MPTSKEARRLRRQNRKASNSRRLTEAGALELAIAVAQHFYYEYDNPIMSDAEYDRLEVRYLRYLKKSGSPGGISTGILDQPGCPDTLRTLLLEWRK